MNNYFTGCDSIEDGKKLFRKLAFDLHPDQGGEEETFKILMADWELFLKSFIAGRFSTASEKHTEGRNMFYFQNILNKIIGFNMKIEINGFWIYAYDSYDYKDQLKDLGFWFSGKHKAWVYNGGSKVAARRSKWTMNKIKYVYGSDSIREEEILSGITA